MTTHEALVAARSRAQVELASRFLAARLATEFADGDAADMAARFLADLEAEGWHHRSAHTAEPPPGSRTPADDEHVKQTLADMRAQLAAIHDRHKAEDAAKEVTDG